MSTQIETAWLIEKTQEARKGAPVYWGVEEGEPGWTYDHRWAARYYSKEDAEQVANDLGLDDWVVCEHAWQ